jgi:hypothetical protein
MISTLLDETLSSVAPNVVINPRLANTVLLSQRHITAPTTTVMNSRRLIACPEAEADIVSASVIIRIKSPLSACSGSDWMIPLSEPASRPATRGLNRCYDLGEPMSRTIAP